MPRNTININTDALVRFTRDLEFMGKKSLPRAVRNTLNNLAFDVKKRTLAQEASKAFVNRNKSFYKRFSKVQKASGTNIKGMKAIVGMSTQGAAKTARQAIENQTQQQLGGTIGNRTLVPLKGARAGNNNSRNVKTKFRTSNLRVDLDTANSKGATEKDRFIGGVITALDRFGGEAIVKHRAKSGKEIIYHVKKGGKSFKTREFSVKVTAIYSVKEGRSVKIDKAQPFTKIAANRSLQQANKFFRKNARHELNKIR